MSKSYVAILLDKSGSMANRREATVSSYNEQIQQLQINAREGEDIAVSLLTFNGGVYEHLWNVPADQLELASVDGYNPEGSTNIWDAIGYTIKRWATDTDAENPENTYLINVISDGIHEHHGRVDWTAARLRDHIAELQSTKRWAFSFLGCNPSIVEQFAQQTGITKDNMGVWSNRSQAAMARTAGTNAAGALKNYYANGKANVNYYSPQAGVAMDFAAVDPGNPTNTVNTVDNLQPTGVLDPNSFSPSTAVVGSAGLHPDAATTFGCTPASYTYTGLRSRGQIKGLLSSGPRRSGPGGQSASNYNMPMAGGSEPPLLNSEMLLSVEEPPKYILGTANVFGNSRKL